MGDAAQYLFQGLNGLGNDFAAMGQQSAQFNEKLRDKILESKKDRSALLELYPERADQIKAMSAYDVMAEFGGHVDTIKAQQEQAQTDQIRQHIRQQQEEEAAGPALAAAWQDYQGAAPAAPSASAIPGFDTGPENYVEQPGANGAGAGSARSVADFVRGGSWMNNPAIMRNKAALGKLMDYYFQLGGGETKPTFFSPQDKQTEEIAPGVWRDVTGPNTSQLRYTNTGQQIPAGMKIKNVRQDGKRTTYEFEPIPGTKPNLTKTQMNGVWYNQDSGELVKEVAPNVFQMFSGNMALPGAAETKPLTTALRDKFLKDAGGDKAKARAAATEAGYDVSKTVD